MLLSADRLNADCACVSLDRRALLRELDAIVGDPQFGARLAASHPTLLSNLPVYLRPDHVARMAAIIRAIEAVAQTPAYQEAAFAAAPPIARYNSGAIGALMGYDFHLGEDGPKLIEINTNAGGALINAVLAKAQTACCAPAAAFLPQKMGSDPSHPDLPSKTAPAGVNFAVPIGLACIFPMRSSGPVRKSHAAIGDASLPGSDSLPRSARIALRAGSSIALSSFDSVAITVSNCFTFRANSSFGSERSP